MSEDGGRTLHEAGGVCVCEAEFQQAMALRLLLRSGCVGTRRVLQEPEHRQWGKSHCRELLTPAGPMAYTSFHITHGFKQPPASAQDSGLIHHPPVVKGKESLNCPVLP